MIHFYVTVMLLKLVNIRCVESLGFPWVAGNMLSQGKSENSMNVYLILSAFLCT